MNARAVNLDEATLRSAPISQDAATLGVSVSGSRTLPAGDSAAATGGAGGLVPLVRGSLVGRYMILGLLGAGGMGAVYAAHDPELDRKVALKLLLTGAGQDEGARMLREARGLAKLAHPNVVAVHDVGLHERHGLFIAMEFVDGLTARAWLAQRPRPLPEVLAVFLAAARGLAAAHRAGLVHRDFKPDNVMVGADGRARVMDFGLVRAVRERHEAAPTLETAPGDLSGHLTRAGSLLGTPFYMAPEQWEAGEVDARTDQFAFCVALWEALHGERPFRGGTVVELMHSILAGQLVRPRLRVPRWLSRALARGLARRPEDRYPSMDDLLADLERGLSRGRLRPLALGLGLAGLAFGGVAGAQVRARAACEAEGAAIAEVWDDDARAALRAALLATGAPFAQDSYERALPYLDRWSAAWADTRTHLCTDATVDAVLSRDVYDKALACLDDQRELLAATLGAYTTGAGAAAQRLIGVAAGLPESSTCADPGALARRPELPADAATRARVLEIRRELLVLRGRRSAGDCAGVERAQALLGEAEDLDHPPLVLDARDALAELAECSDAWGRAEVAARGVFVEAAALHADERAAAAAIQLVRVVGRDRGRSAEALQWALPAEGFVRRLGEEEGLLAANLAQGTAFVHLARGEHDAALADGARALELREAKLGAGHPSLATTFDLLGDVHRARGAHAEALAAYTRSLELRREALGPSHPWVATSLHNLGLAEQNRGDLPAAEARLEEAAALTARALGPDALELANTLNHLGRVKHLRGDLAGAEEDLGRALAIREAKLGADHLDTARTLDNLGLIRLVRGDRLGARDLFTRALAAREARLPPDSLELTETLDNLAGVSHRLGDYAGAEQLQRRALEIQRTYLAPGHAAIAESLRKLALVRDAVGAGDEALTLAREALGLAEAASGKQHFDLVPFLNTLGLAERRRDPNAAVATLERALTLGLLTRGPRHPATATTLLRLGEAQLARGDLDAAQISLGQALSIREEIGADTPEVADVLVDLGELHLARGRRDEARVVLERAVEIRGGPGVPAHELALARFALARALPPAERARARALADEAAAGLAGAPGREADRAALDAWLRASR